MASWTRDCTSDIGGPPWADGLPSHIDGHGYERRRNIDGCQYVAHFMDVKPIEACCAPVLDGALTEAEAVDLAAAFKVLADPARLRLLSMIAAGDEACACDLVEPLGRSQPTV